ncbi:YicC family protein [Falsochrobactrum sp. TDYN1]|uniref:YicC family protein n=1 Tax=Falsochrobactrum tianjinense TaxID=2706015 RepID=A0A949USH7_9HYPH|nr:YicC/YloC family endoribonuclease [Falsochrobactrum sp. TDYN1]MBV2142559.1 YicC family protein [Falsochrobactrum sp. TDYN1]
MALQSMTGFARHAVQHSAAGPDKTNGEARIVWEVRSVNGKGLDLRLRLPPGLEATEHPVRSLLARYFSRGNFQATLNVEYVQAQAGFTVNQAMLDEVLKLGAELQARHGLAPASIDGIFSLRGIIDQTEVSEDEATRAELEAAIVVAFEGALKSIAEAREHEGNALFTILSGHVDTIEGLTLAARNDPSRGIETIKARLAAQVSLLLDGAHDLDDARLYQEAAFLATKADIQEELDRLETHVASARKLLADGGPIGRKLDFLSQEFNREANTLCAKSNAASITAIGLELKAIVDQFREQVQNLE